MTDNLRTRIAAAIVGTGCPCTACTAVALEKADAVIRELGLQTLLAKRMINGKPDQWVRRHVTNWEIVE